MFGGAALWAAAAASAAAGATAAAAGADGGTAAFPVPDKAGCRGAVYLTLDTGSMRHAEAIAAILARHRVRATFFVADEATDDGGGALGPAWAGYWRARVDEGHRFGSHTHDHVYFSALPGGDGGQVRARPQFGPSAGRTLVWGPAEVCAEIARAGERFAALTGQPLDPFWRAPGGRGPQPLFRMAAGCGWRHVGWTPDGFLGDELPSDRFPNAALLAQSLARIRDGDILMAHLGIRSRQDPYAPMLDPLIAGLRERGLCFRTLAEHPLASSSPTGQALPAPRAAPGASPKSNPKSSPKSSQKSIPNPNR